MGDETLWMGERTLIETYQGTRFDDILERWIQVSDKDDIPKPKEAEEDLNEDVWLVPKEVKEASNLALASPMINSKSLLRVHELSLLELAESVADKTLRTYLKEYLLPEDYDFKRVEKMNRLQLLAAIAKWRAKV